MKELVHFFRQIEAQDTSHCVLCLRTKNERKLLAKNSLRAVLEALSNEDVWPWKGGKNKTLLVCFVCEARLASTLKVIRLVKFGVLADQLLAEFKKKNLPDPSVLRRGSEHPLKRRYFSTQTMVKSRLCSHLVVTETLCLSSIEGKGIGKGNQQTAAQSNDVIVIDDNDTDCTANRPGPMVQKSHLANTINHQTLNPNTVNQINNVNMLNTGIQNHITTPTVPNNLVHQIKLGNEMLTNTGQFLALKNPDSTAVLHAIYKCAEEKMYVPTLSVMIEGEKLVPMPNVGPISVSSTNINTIPPNLNPPPYSLIAPDPPSLNIYKKLTPLNDKPVFNKVTSPQLKPFKLKTVPNPNIPTTRNILSHKCSKLAPLVRPFSSEETGKLRFSLNSENPIPVPNVPVSASARLQNPPNPPDDLLIEPDSLTGVTDPVEEDPLSIIPAPISLKSEPSESPTPDDTFDEPFPVIEKQKNVVLGQNGAITDAEIKLLQLNYANNFKEPIVYLKRLPFLERMMNQTSNYATNNASKSLLKPYKDVNQRNRKPYVKIQPKKTGQLKCVQQSKLLSNMTFESSILIDSDSNGSDSKAVRQSVLPGCLTTGLLSEDPVQVVKFPKMKDGNIDWEDKIPMDVITYADATDPATIVLPQSPHDDVTSRDVLSRDVNGLDGTALGVILDTYSESDKAVIIDIDD